MRSLILWLENPHLLLALFLVLWSKPTAFLQNKLPQTLSPHTYFPVNNGIYSPCQSKFIRYVKTQRDLYLPHINTYHQENLSGKFPLLLFMWEGVLSGMADDGFCATCMRTITCVLQCLLNITYSNDDRCFYRLDFLGFWLTVYFHFPKQIEKTVQYNEKSNSISHCGLKKMLIMFFTSSAFSSCF